MEAKRTILIIDDDEALRLGLTITLQRRGYSVVSAENGRDGLEKIKLVAPDLILCDVMMPPPNGFELRKQLSADPDFANLPFVFLTARAGVADRIEGMDDGADDYITKPFEPQELVARLEAIFRRVEVERERGRRQMQAVAAGEMAQFKQEVIQNLHHELRTPLTNILMPLEAILNNKFDNPADQAHFVRMALLNADRLNSLSTDFILLTNLDHGGLNTFRQVVYVENDLLGAIQRRLERYKSKKLRFETRFDLQSELRAPRREFTHVLIHVLDNAFKFSPENGRVELAISVTPASEATIQVRDEGPGIPAELREKVFDRFFQGSQGDTREQEGLGVGLTLAKAVVELLGGQIRLLEQNSGCGLELWLPAPAQGEGEHGQPG